MKRLLAAAAAACALGAAAVAGASAAHAGPTCQFLGQNYNVDYDCLAPQPWLPYGTANNPPLGGSAVTPGGDGPSGGYHWQPKSPACPACSS
ncbi:hypothetical protein [Mycobacterium avium]|uniref:hypothetical protein n=1 Tax=Mycobacterium avium TaxID=1764 RepID=UPI000B4BF0B1|nr:hypothetical protein [Mycobacterium avium]